jgi:hypothetical protein
MTKYISSTSEERDHEKRRLRSRNHVAPLLRHVACRGPVTNSFCQQLRMIRLIAHASAGPRSPPRRASSSARLLLESQFGPQTVPVPTDRGNGTFPPLPPETNDAVMGGWFAFDLQPIPVFGMANIGNGKIVMLAPEEGYSIVAHLPAQDVPRCDLSLPLGNNPVLDPDALTAGSVRPTDDITGGVDRPDTGPQKLVHQHPAINAEARLFGKRGGWSDANADHDKIRLDAMTSRQGYGFWFDRGDGCAEVEHHPMCLVDGAHHVPISAPRTRSIGHASGATTCTANPRDRSAEATSRPMKLAPTTTQRWALPAAAIKARLSASERSMYT